MRFILFFSLSAIICSAQAQPVSVHFEQERLFKDSLFQHRAVPQQIHKGITELSHITYGFVPYWERTYNCPRWDLVSRIAYFNCTIGSDGSITATNHWYDAAAVDYALANGVAVDLCIAQFTNSTINALISSASARANGIHNSIEAMLARSGTGINIDFEYPSSGYGDEFVTFMAEFRDSLNARGTGYWLSVCLPDVDWGNAYFTDQLKNYCDAMFIMSYGAHWGGSAYTGAVDPLDDPTESWDIAYSVNHYVTQSGAPEKIVLGLPAYGYDWPCDGPDKGAATTGSGSAVIYINAIANAETYGRLWDTDATSPWYRYSSWHQCWYSDSTSLDIRYAYAKTHGLQGVGWWALGYDDGDLAFWGAVENEFYIPTGTDTTDTIIVDNGDPEYTHGGTWYEGTYDPSSGWENDYEYCTAGGALDWAHWTPYIPMSGYYYVYMWWYAGSNRCNNVFVRIVGEDDDTVFVSQQGTGSDWHYLGRYAFDEGSAGFVGINDQTTTDGSVVIADAVMWIYESGLDIAEKHLAKPNDIDILVSPNPFNSSCKIAIDGVGAGLAPAQIEIYDLRGNAVATPYPDKSGFVPLDKGDSPAPAGQEVYIWHPALPVPSGIYFVRATAAYGSTITKRIVYLK